MRLPLLPFLSMASRSAAPALLLALAMLATVPARADDTPPGRIGRLADLSGSVRHFGASGWEPVLRNEPLSTGDRVATDHDARAVVQVGSTTVRLGPDSEIVVARLDDVSVRLRLDHGELTLRLRRPEVAGEFSIETADGFLVPKEPAFVHVSIESGHTFAASWQGGARFEGRDSTQMDLKAGQRAEYWRGAKDAAQFALRPMPTGKFAVQAVKDDAAEARSTAGESHLPLEMTGGAELNALGHWQRSAIGWLWTPPATAGWAPFHDGRWTWAPPWGWTWVDDAHWGFAPSHYGRWTHQDGKWAWAPGPLPAARPTYLPATVAWLGGAAFKLPAAGGLTEPAIGWLAAGPNEPVFGAAGVTTTYWRLINPAVMYPYPRPAAGGQRLVPGGAMAFANGGAKGGAMFMAADRPVAREQVVAMKGSGATALAAAVAEGKAEWRAPPPAPPGRGEIDASLPEVSVDGAAASRRLAPGPSAIIAPPAPLPMASAPKR